MAVVYGILGLVVILTAGTFGTINASPWFNLGIAVLFVALALAMFDVFEIDGHDPATLLAVLGAAPGTRPRCIIANTTKGKGVSFMEGVASWHHGVPNDAQYEQAMKELV